MINALSGAVWDIAEQMVIDQRSISCLDWGQVAQSALTDGLSGGIGKLRKAGAVVKAAEKVANKGRGTNPYKRKTADQLEKMFLDKGFKPTGKDPKNGVGTYLNPKTGRAYHIDAKHPPPKPPHVGVIRPRQERGGGLKKGRDYEL